MLREEERDGGCACVRASVRACVSASLRVLQYNVLSKYKRNRINTY